MIIRQEQTLLVALDSHRCLPLALHQDPFLHPKVRLFQDLDPLVVLILGRNLIKIDESLNVLNSVLLGCVQVDIGCHLVIDLCVDLRFFIFTLILNHV